MKEWSDEELDKLFRKSAEEFDPEFEQKDWNDLRSRLDADEKTPAGWLQKTTTWLAVLLLLMIGGWGVYGIWQEESKVDGDKDAFSAGKPALSSKSAAQKYRTQSSPQKSAEETVIDEQKDKNETEVYKDLRELAPETANVSGVRKRSGLSPVDNGKGANLFPDTKNTERFSQTDNTQKQSVKGVEFSEKRETATGVDDTNLKMPLDVSAVAEKFTLEKRPERSMELLDRREVAQFGTRLPYPNVAYKVRADSLSKPKPPVQEASPRWAVRVGFSPDMSSVGMKQMTRPGPSASLFVDYYISRKLALQTGIVRSLKTYSALPGQYEWPTSWTQKQMPSSVDGSCQVFELPVNLRYDIRQGQISRWFVSSGVSSYKMQNEKYTYHYKYYDPNIRWWNWEGKTGWYLFSHLNVSAGYERRLSKHVSLVAEPFLRVPLRGVGFGKVNLYTAGMWFSARYTPTFKK
ncbi:porin family protein [Arundinibacter roseus]|uniref:PorT family protein n=1 Tax=Arundinibacter roseus TaxID=2070510 RepID=A0A4R4KB86_9BACT|nr:porin family protein [Arundinibacter roseus]TDB63721.1 PorT family protein [Arundinibacter roseus]